MRVLDLFSGIGGFSLGLERAGMHTVAFCERDEFCRAVLRKHWPDVPCFNDIHAIDSDGLDRLGRIDLVCGGFPCQPFSHAGPQRAQDDDRHLWPQMRKVIALARPAWVLGENVAGIIPLALDDVLADLENDGYAPRAFVIPACAVNAPHRRDRVWIIARDADSQSESASALNAEVAELCRDGSDAGGQPNGYRHHGASSALRSHHEGDEGPRRTLQSSEQWLTESGLDRVAHGIPHRAHRLRALGNAVVPQVVEEIGRAIMRDRTNDRQDQ